MPKGVYIRTKPGWNKGQKGRKSWHNISGLRPPIKKARIKLFCLYCQSGFEPEPYREKEAKYCSKQCYWNSKKGMVSPYKGKHPSEKTRKKMRMRALERWQDEEYRMNMSIKHKLPRPFIENEKHPGWKGDKVGYSGLHWWIRRKLGSPSNCKNCGIGGKKIGGRWSIEWANKSGEYKRDFNDWIPLCSLCHRRYDLENKNKTIDNFPIPVL